MMPDHVRAAHAEKKFLLASERRALRKRLMKKQNARCHWCGGKMSKKPRIGKKDNPNYATFEHLERRRDGGTFKKDNIVLAHQKCNHRREELDQMRAKALNLNGE